MVQIINKEQLIQNGKNATLKKARALALNSLEAALNAADPVKILKDKLKLDSTTLCIDGKFFDLQKIKHVYVVGGGKAAAAMAKAVEEILGSYITDGAVNVPYGTKPETKTIKLQQASHPVPDEAGIEGVKHIMEIAKQATADDLVICLISGGGSSLMPLPREGVTLQEKQEITGELLRSGASIAEVNIVRKHLSSFKGGWLAKTARQTKLVSLILSDVVDDPLDAIASGPTIADPSTFADSKKVLEKYSLWNMAPASVRKIFSEGAESKLEETPKPGDAAFANVLNILVGNNRIASQAAAEYLKSEGLKTVHFDEPLDGEARAVGRGLAGFASKAAGAGFSLPKPIAVVAGGETTVKVTGKGLGGRNQELALAAAINLKDAQGCVVASLSTDGIDGPTKAAGAIADEYTFFRALDQGLDAQAFLAENDSFHFFSELGDLIFTGATGTNVNDISVIIVL
jgi:glycerate 2-kinase